jgi:hypothetical protein
MKGRKFNERIKKTNCFIERISKDIGLNYLDQIMKKKVKYGNYLILLQFKVLLPF